MAKGFDGGGEEILPVAGRQGYPEGIQKEADEARPWAMDNSAWHMTIDNSTVLSFPRGGGLRTEDREESCVLTEQWTILEGVLLDTLPAGAGTLQIQTDDGLETMLTLAIPATVAGYFPRWIPFGYSGISILRPWGVKLSQAAHRVHVFFRLPSLMSR